MTRLRPFVAALWLASLLSFVVVNIGTAHLVEALITHGLAVLVLATALPLTLDSAFKQEWFAFAVGEHCGLMALSLVLLVLGGGTRIEMALAAGLSIAGLSILIVALHRMRRRRLYRQLRPSPTFVRPGTRRRAEAYFNETRVPKGRSEALAGPVRRRHSGGQSARGESRV